VKTLSLLLPLVSLLACGSDVGPEPEPPPPCEQLCQDQTALRTLRESMKLVFNLALQGKPVGMHDYMVACPLGGKARIFGEAFSNATQGSTDVKLTYVLEACTVLERDDEPNENYRMTVTGTVRQEGVLAVQPTATMALSIQSADVTLVGTVYDPPIAYEAKSCPIVLSQAGSKLSGTICGRATTTDL
jgi:hypothetical protein